jgi:hypothetical protein
VYYGNPSGDVDQRSTGYYGETPGISADTGTPTSLNPPPPLPVYGQYGGLGAHGGGVDERQGGGVDASYQDARLDETYQDARHDQTYQHHPLPSPNLFSRVFL